VWVFAKLNLASFIIKSYEIQDKIDQDVSIGNGTTFEGPKATDDLKGGGGSLPDPRYLEIFQNLLRSQGLYLKEMKKDGNCLFRAVADQLEDDEENHNLYRSVATDFLKKNKEKMKKFIAQENGENIDEYIAHMEKDGSWGGHLELSALSHKLNLTIKIYIKDQECITIEGTQRKGARLIRIAFHKAQEHYDSIKRLDGKSEEWLDLVYTKQGTLDRRCSLNQGVLALEQVIKEGRR